MLGHAPSTARPEVKMHEHWVMILLLAAALAGCSTPYRPPVVVKGSDAVPALAGMLAEAPAPKQLDVMLVHGMCTHEANWAEPLADHLAQQIDAQARSLSSGRAVIEAAPGRIGVRWHLREAAGGQLHFAELTWSAVFAELKQQLAFDMTGEASDCAADAECRPRRAKLNGMLKDKLLNDCLADVVIYQGQSRDAMRSRMVVALQEFAERSGDEAVPLAIVSESLGSKIVFDALLQMLDQPPSSQARTAGVRIGSRLAAVYMLANQLPLLGLAEQNVDAKGNNMALGGALQRLLERLRAPGLRKSTLGAIRLVAFTDPNDLLSYRLLPSGDRSLGRVEVADVLVSNRPTWLSLFEWPPSAHTDYGFNDDVLALIACGQPRSGRCR